MALPKAVLCSLGNSRGDEEASLRAVGFATASLSWRELETQQNGWIQLLPVLEDPSVVLWVIAGAASDFTPEVRSRIAMLALAARREKDMQIAFALSDEDDFTDVPPALGNIRIFRPGQPFAAKLMASRMRPAPRPELPFFCVPRLDALLGQWIEVAPPSGKAQEGFMAGVFGAEVLAFGTGPTGEPPQKSTLFYPQLGIKGDIRGKEFCACAAKNPIGEGVSCFMKVEGSPEGVFLAGYPSEDEAEGEERPLLAVELV